ncbi:putative oxidoreductase [Colletotrichum sidae]|uniref:Putative oxidoreductase n=1 Tax=Colletotrichum sidae TaxID=1347389 RepID=A0A4R8T503_9PEZI|nr:putative oxidoreductase [Colletotrichum sidae]
MSTCTPHQVFPPKPNFTEENLPDQTGKVFLVTGGASGIGLELCKLLYAANATIYIATRSVSKTASAMQDIEACSRFSQGRLESLSLDLADLSTIKPAAEEFLARELRLDVLVHNAGVMMPPKGSMSAQGYEMQMATNTLGPFLLTQCLEERLRATTRMQNAAKDSVRVVWIASMISVGAPKGGIVWNDETNSPKLLGDPMGDYMQSKVGCVFLANKFGKKMKDDGIISLE